MKPFTALCVSVLILAASAVPSTADDISASAVSQSTAPVAITRCLISNVYQYTFSSSFNLYNRSSHSVIDTSIDYRFFDRDNAQIGKTVITYTPAETLSPQDTGSFNNNTNSISLAEPPSAVSRVTCRVSAAHFTGRLTWKPGLPWQGGTLSAPPKIDSSSTGDGQGTANAVPVARGVAPAKTAVTFDVNKAWNDQAATGMLVHDSLLVHGGNVSVTIQPTNFSLTMVLADGQQRTYAALTRAAPTYQKYNALSKEVTTAYEIDPKMDLGSLGSVTIPPHTDAPVTVTFAVNDRVADALANKQVSFK